MREQLISNYCEARTIDRNESISCELFSRELVSETDWFNHTIFKQLRVNLAHSLMVLHYKGLLSKLMYPSFVLLNCKRYHIVTCIHRMGLWIASLADCFAYFFKFIFEEVLENDRHFLSQCIIHDDKSFEFL